MHWIFQAVSDRLKALFVSQVALDLEAEFTAQHAARQAELLRQAELYEAEGLKGVAAGLRERAEALRLERPLASILPATAELHRPVLDGASQTPAISPPAKHVPLPFAISSPKRSKAR